MLFGWQPVESLFFGSVVAISSTTVLSKVLEERGETGVEYGRLAFAWATVQDLAAIALVVLLTTLSHGGEDLGWDLAWELGRAVVFLALLIPVGLFVLPSCSSESRCVRNREVFILSVGAVALGAAFVASLFGISIALGAFVAGVLVGESDLSHQILGEVEPLRDILAGLFFVSVGMLVDPMLHRPECAAGCSRRLRLIVLLKGLVIAGLIRAVRLLGTDRCADGRGAVPGRRVVVPAGLDWRGAPGGRHDGVQRDAGRLSTEHDAHAAVDGCVRSRSRAASTGRARSILARSCRLRRSGGGASRSSAGTGGWGR